MDKDTFYITQENMLKLGITPKDGVDYLENKQAMTVNPVHVKALQLLKKQPAVPSS